MASTEDYEMFLLLSGGCSLDSSPKSNWVEENGGLPQYICRIAKAIMRSGKSKSQAIAIAVSRVKKWAAGGDDVDADTRAKAAAAVAQWTKLKAKNKAGNVKLSREQETEYLMLTYIPSYNTEIVRNAWNAKRRADSPDTYAGDGMVAEARPYQYLKEVWTDYIIVETEGDGVPTLEKIPFRVNPLSGKVIFDQPVPVAQVYVEIPDELNGSERRLLSDLLG